MLPYFWFFCEQNIMRKYKLREKVQAQHQTYALGIKEVIYVIFELYLLGLNVLGIYLFLF